MAYPRLDPSAPTAGYSARPPYGAAEAPEQTGGSVSPLRRFLNSAAIMGAIAGVYEIMRTKARDASGRAAPPPAEGLVEIRAQPEGLATPAHASTGSQLERALLDAVLAESIEDDPREIYANEVERLLGDHSRAAFIRLQLRQFREKLTGSELRQLLRDIDDLMCTHGERWAGDVAGLVSYYHFSRGFVELVGTTAAGFLVHAPRLFKAAPVMHLQLTGHARDIDALLGSPHLETIRSLSLDGWGLGDREAERLAESSHLPELRWLSLAKNSISRDGVEALANSGNFPGLQFVNLAGNPSDPGERYAHDDGRIVDKWRPHEAYSLSLRRRVAWLDLDRTDGKLLPDRFEMAKLPIPTEERGYALAC